MINPMMYRVFLQDEKDAPDPSKNPSDKFRIRGGSMLAWCYSSPGWKPNLEEQLRAMSPGFCVYAEDETLDGHYLIWGSCCPLGIAHTLEETSCRVYELAKNNAIELAKNLSEATGKPYTFIDVTSRGNKELAEKLLQTIHEEEVYVPSPSAADIGD